MQPRDFVWTICQNIAEAAWDLVHRTGAYWVYVSISDEGIFAEVDSEWMTKVDINGFGYVDSMKVGPRKQIVELKTDKTLEQWKLQLIPILSKEPILIPVNGWKEHGRF